MQSLTISATLGGQTGYTQGGAEQSDWDTAKDAATGNETLYTADSNLQSVDGWTNGSAMVCRRTFYTFQIPSSIIGKISLDPKKEWPRGYIENSRWALIHFFPDGTLDTIRMNGYSSYETRKKVPILRKSKNKSLKHSKKFEILRKKIRRKIHKNDYI